MGRFILVSHAGALGRQFARELPDPFGVAVLGFVIFLVGAWWFRGVISRIFIKDLPRLLAHALNLCRRSNTVDQTPLLADGQSRSQGSVNSQESVNSQNVGGGLVSAGIVDNANSGGDQARMPSTS
jgi:hypothetical protein